MATLQSRKRPTPKLASDAPSPRKTSLPEEKRKVFFETDGSLAKLSDKDRGRKAI